MAQMSNYLEEKLIDLVFRNTAFATPGTVYVALYSTDPTDADTGTELTGDGYARVAVTIGAPVDGVSLNTVDVVFPAATADWTAVSHIAIRDALTAGNMLMHKALPAPVSILSTNTFRIPTGDLSVTFA